MRTSDDRAGEWWPPSTANSEWFAETGRQFGRVMAIMYGGFLVALLLFVGELFSWAQALRLALLGLAAVGAGCAVEALARRRVAAWQVGERGLRALRWWHPALLYPWPAIRSVAKTPRHLEVRTDHEALRIPCHGRHGAELERRLRAGLDQQPSEAREIEEAQVADWLGIKPDGELAATMYGRISQLLVAAWCGILALSLVGGAEASDFAMPAMMAFVFLGSRRLKPVTVTASGFRRGDEWLADWDDVTGLKRQGGGALIRTDRGDVWIPPEGSERIVETAERVLAAKRRGAVLPRMGPASDYAISRAEPDSVSAERGLSQPE